MDNVVSFNEKKGFISLSGQNQMHFENGADFFVWSRDFRASL